MTAAQQVALLRAQLLEAYIQKEQADEKIKAIRNVLAGLGIGQELQKEIDAVPAPAQ
jgi:hypothetical protein